ncbi:2-oxoglutarate-dependent dioxygenase AOP2-like [Cryptomeria japonica]|uniref:2-oxoglutarate-dependent dioxygenase AOP2-like n=1 Tax=Cryptomeria japonica TaxID=3369 RepID=UPI0027DA7DB2|nr:2-oxoglutarate-dependent dioxygenase AOP2-like [Cryptomeria japonica]
MAFYESEANLDYIPTLDLSRCGDQKCLQTIKEACQELGCFRIVNHGIAPDHLLKADQACREVFKLPTETKRKNMSSNPLAGYLGGISKIPFYESEGIILTELSHSETLRDFSRLMWPHGNQNFCETMEEYTRKMVVLLNEVHKIILASFGVSEYFATHFDHGKAIFLMNLYDVTSELLDESIGLSPHTDLNSLTILHEDECGGFQIWNKAGNWVDVKSISNSFVAVMGDGFQIKAPPEFIDDQHPQCYKAFAVGDFIKYWLGKGRAIEDRLHSFARIND